MKDSVFLDSNIFLYAFSNKDIDKQKIATTLVMHSDIISTQVINEVSNNLIKKLGFPNNEIGDFVKDCYQKYMVVDFTKHIFIKASELRDKYNFSYYDCIFSTLITCNYSLQ